MPHLSPAFIKELQAYTYAGLSLLLQLEGKRLNKFLQKLILAGVVKSSSRKRVSKSNDEYDFDVWNEEECDKLYSFHFVGTIHLDGRLIFVYPKYYEKEISIADFKLVLDVIRKYRNHRVSRIEEKGGADIEGSVNTFSIYLFIISDYIIHGAYDATLQVVHEDDKGLILWEKTVNEKIPFFQNGTPIYMDCYRRCSTVDSDNFFTRLHLAVVSSCSRKIKKMGLSEVFDLTLSEPSDEDIADFGDEEYLRYRILCELQVQYDSRNRLILFTLLSYLLRDRANESESGRSIELYGSTSFNLIWEHVCASVLASDLDVRLNKISCLRTNHGGTMKEAIEHPEWQGYANYGEKFIKTAETLKPDLLKFYWEEENTSLAILDAKYYTIQLKRDKKLMGQPGVADITKQYLYHLAYSELLNTLGVRKVVNSFLVPHENLEFQKLGEASMKMLSDLNLSDIEVIMLPARYMYEKYLQGATINVKDVFDNLILHVE